MKSPWRDGWLPLLLLWGATLGVALFARPFMPIDETRYVTVAWEMWLRGDFLVPYLNGETYAHKPPLLFWLYQLGWWLFGVNDWWPRLVAPLFGLGSLVLTAHLARRLWPEARALARLAPWLLFGSVYWTGYGTAAMFDMLVVFFTLVGLLGVWQAGQGRPTGWLWLALAIGLGVLAKGPVILLHTLPVALLAPWWSNEARSHKGTWYLRLLGALTLGAALALAWAVPAALRGGEAYANAIFWGQTANRVVDSFAHKRPLWWYLPLLPLLFYPWFWWPPAWRGIKSLGRMKEPAMGFLLAGLVPSFIAMSLISGKQVHYLLPLFPAVALLLARGLTHGEVGRLSLRLPGVMLALFSLLVFTLPWWRLLPDWAEELQAPWALLPVVMGALFWRWRPSSLSQAVQGLTLSSVLLVVVLHLVMHEPLARAYDLRPVAKEIARLQRAGAVLVHESKYAGEYHFLGRLEAPLKVIYKGHLADWARRHPDGYIVYYYTRWEKGLLPQECHFWQYYRGGYVAVIPGHFYLDQLADTD